MLHVKNAAVVQRLVHLIAIQMMTVRFRSVAPLELSIADTKVLAIFSLYSIWNWESSNKYNRKRQNSTHFPRKRLKKIILHGGAL